MEAMNTSFSSLIKFSFLPASADLGLLILRVWLGLSMLLIHGIGKIANFNATVAMFHTKMGFSTPVAMLGVAAEAVFSVLLILGLVTRLSALALAVQMGVAFAVVHKMVLNHDNPHTGELAFIYLAGFVALFLAGPGRFSVDGAGSK
jgi:putative oxidoreductase